MTVFPAHIRVCGVAPCSFRLVIRVAAVVFNKSSIGSIIPGIAVRMWGLGIPCLALSSRLGHCNITSVILLVHIRASALGWVSILALGLGHEPFLVQELINSFAAVGLADDNFFKSISLFSGILPSSVRRSK